MISTATVCCLDLGTTGKERGVIEPRKLVGSSADDPADMLACMHERFMALPPGVSAYDWEAAGRLIPSPPSVEEGPFVEIRFAPTPQGAWAGVILRRVASGEQPIWQILKDVRRYPVYRIKAPGIRIKDRHSDSRLVGGPRALRKESEEARVHDEDLSLVTPGATAPSERFERTRGTSREWEAIAAYMEEPILGVLLPDDAPPSMIRPDWPIIASVPRLDALIEGGHLDLIYEGEQRMRYRDFLCLTDAAGRPVARRFAYDFARQIAHDFFSPRRKRSRRDWVTLALAVLPPLGAIATLAAKLIELLS